MKNQEIRDFKGVEEFSRGGEGVKMPQENGNSEGVGVFRGVPPWGGGGGISGTTQCKLH